MHADATTSTTTTPALNASGHPSFSVNGRTRSIQPNGVNHSIHFVASPESAIIRTTNMTPSTPNATPLATRRVRPSCEVSAPTPTKTAGAITRLRP